MTNEIDQRAQRLDPASQRPNDPDDRSDAQTKQPGGIRSVQETREDGSNDPAMLKSNTRDGGHGEITTNNPVAHIKHSAEGKRSDLEDDPDHRDVRPAGREDMKNPPKEWKKEDEESDESFPASDPPGNY